MRGLHRALAVLGEEPSRKALWHSVLDLVQSQDGHGRDVLAAIRGALPLVQGDRDLHVSLLTAAALLVESTGGDAGEALACALRVGLLGGDYAVAIRMLRSADRRYGSATIERARAQLDLDAEQIAAVRAVIAQAPSAQI